MANKNNSEVDWKEKDDYAKMVEIEASLQERIQKFQYLSEQYEYNSHFRAFNGDLAKITEAECWMTLGDMKRQMALMDLGNILGHTPETKERQEKLVEVAQSDIEQGLDIYKKQIKRKTKFKKKAKMGTGHYLKCRGLIKRDLLKDVVGARDDYKKALAIYEECGDPDAHAEMEYMVEQIEFEVDKVATITRKIAEMTEDGNKEKEAVETAFKKFDTDGSGIMDMKEFHELAAELGTYPPLTEAERLEGLKQLDEDMSGELSFEEFWAWWVSDEVESEKAKGVLA